MSQLFQGFRANVMLDLARISLSLFPVNSRYLQEISDNTVFLHQLRAIFFPASVRCRTVYHS